MLGNDAKDKVIKLLRKKINLNNNDFKLYLLDKFERESKFTRPQLISIWNDITDLNTLDEVQLCILFKEFSKRYNTIGKVDEFFTDIEIEESENYRYVDSELHYPITFKNAIRLNEDQYTVVMSCDFIVKLQNAGLLKVNANTQRETRIRAKDNYKFESVITYGEQVKEISKAYESNSYFPDEIKLNLEKDGTDLLEYDEENLELTIHAGNIYKIDGNHRIYAMIETYSNEKRIDLNFSVTFFNVTETKAQEIINQQEKKRPIKKSRIDSFKNTAENNIVNKIKDSIDLNDILKNKFVRDKNNIISSNSIFVMSTLARAIRIAYSKEDLQRYKEETTEWLIKFLNELAYVMEDIFKDSRKAKNETWAIDDVAIYLYMNISKHLQDNNNWRKELSSIIDKIDFSRFENPIGNYGKDEVTSARNYLKEILNNDE